MARGKHFDAATDVEPEGLPAERPPSGGERVYLLVRAGEGEGTRVLEVTDGQTVTIGRDPEATLVVDDTRASRRHAELSRRGDVLAVKDLGSRNGTRLNALVLRGAEALAGGGDVVGVGPLELVVAAASGGRGAAAATPGPSAAGDGGEAGDADGIGPQGFVVADPAMARVYEVIRRLAKTPTTVLVTGETGVGKEVVAAQLHRWSPRADKPFVCLNCASLPESLLESELFGHERGAFTGADKRKAGYFEAAHGGTLLLDEVGELPLGMQAKLLRVLETRCVTRLGSTQQAAVDVRLVCATHRDVEAEVAAGRFRQDLFYRISTFTLEVPPLRKRPAEIQLLAELFARELAERDGAPPPRFEPALVEALRSHAWPGNVRELRNAIEHAVVLADGPWLRVEHLPASVLRALRPPAPTAPEGMPGRVADVERQSIERALADAGGNRTHAAMKLGISRRALVYKIGKYGIG